MRGKGSEYPPLTAEIHPAVAQWRGSRPPVRETWGRPPGRKRQPILIVLPGKIAEEPDRLQSMGSQSQTQLSDETARGRAAVSPQSVFCPSHFSLFLEKPRYFQTLVSSFSLTRQVGFFRPGCSSAVFLCTLHCIYF